MSAGIRCDTVNDRSFLLDLDMSRLPPGRTSLPSPKVVHRSSSRPSGPPTPNLAAATAAAVVQNHAVRVGDRVLTGGKEGTVAFVGPTEFSEGRTESGLLCASLFSLPFD